MEPINKTDCSGNCLTCYGGDDNQCLSCPTEKVLESGSCVVNCSDGHYPDEDNICQGFYFYLLDDYSIHNSLNEKKIRM